MEHPAWQFFLWYTYVSARSGVVVCECLQQFLTYSRPALLIFDSVWFIYSTPLSAVLLPPRPIRVRLQTDLMGIFQQFASMRHFTYNAQRFQFPHTESISLCLCMRFVNNRGKWEFNRVCGPLAHMRFELKSNFVHLQPGVPLQPTRWNERLTTHKCNCEDHGSLHALFCWF